MDNNLIMLIMGSKYPVAGKSTRGLRFGIGDANPSTFLERMMNNQRIGSQGKRYILGTNLVIYMIVHGIECPNKEGYISLRLTGKKGINAPVVSTPSGSVHRSIEVT